MDTENGWLLFDGGFFVVMVTFMLVYVVVMFVRKKTIERARKESGKLPHPAPYLDPNVAPSALFSKKEPYKHATQRRGPAFELQDEIARLTGKAARKDHGE